MTNLKQLAIASVCTLTLGFGANLASAQAAAQNDPAAQQGNPSAAQQPNPAATPQTEVSDSHLALYAKAATKVEKIRQDIQQQMPEAENAEQAQALQEEAMQQMVSAVESYGMTVDEYNQIAAAVQQDPELQSRLQELL